MRFNQHVMRSMMGLAALSMSLAGCHGSPSGTSAYLPVNSGASSTGAGSVLNQDRPARGEIVSSCGDHVHIVLAGILNCRFNERDYKGEFKLYNHEKGLILLSPTQGTKTTKFTITGLLVGSGYFLVKDSRGHQLTVHTRVTL